MFQLIKTGSYTWFFCLSRTVDKFDKLINEANKIRGIKKISYLSIYIRKVIKSI